MGLFARPLTREPRREIDSWLRFAFRSNPTPMALSRMSDGKIVEVNDAYVAAFDIGHVDEIVGRLPSDCGVIVEQQLRDGVYVRVKHAEVEAQEVRITTRTNVWTARVTSRRCEPHLLTTFEDNSACKHAERAAEHSETRFRELADHINEVFWMTDAAGDKVLYVSSAYERVWGRSTAALAANPYDWLEAIHPDDRERIRQHWADSKTTAVTLEYRIVRPDGAVRRIRDRAFPVLDDLGASIRIVGFADDVTERWELEEQLRQTQKLESLGLLAGGVAHDFNNILAVISASSSMLADDIPPGTADRELVDEIEAAVKRATGLTRQLLAFSRKQVVEPAVLDLNRVANDTRKMLRRMLGEDIALVESLDPELARISIDPGYLVQVIMNLAVNARDAMPRGGTLSIATRNAGERVLLEITDDGTGMTADVRQHLFEPFFTTKGVGKGTGLGLSVVHGIIAQAGGTIEVDSEPGIGTTFQIYFPALAASADEIDDLAVAGALGTEKVLVVDDDHYVRTAASRLLRSRGYTVLEAEDGLKALSMMRKHPDIELLVTDVVMPNMDGRELVTATRAEYPHLKVLYTSGYTDDAIVRHGILTNEVAFIEKPFRMHELARKVRQVLDVHAQ